MGAVRGASAGKRAPIPYFPYFLSDYDTKAGLGLIAHLATVPQGRGQDRRTDNALWMTIARKPQQDRSARSMAKMLDAGEAIFAEGGDGALTVEAVVKRAGTSVGSF